GTGYGPLRYLNPHTATQIRNLPQPQTTLNYLGRFDYPAATPDTGWIPVEGVDLGRPPSNLAAPAVLGIDAATVVVGGTEHLTATWSYVTGVLSAADVTELTDLWTSALTAIADHTSRPGAGHLTPSDLDLVHLDQPTLDALHHDYPTLTDVWPLTPLQAGLLFHAELGDPAADAYLVQLVLDISGPLDADRLRDAAHTLLGRHPNLGAAFTHTADGTPVQVVTTAALAWAHHDVTTAHHPAAVLDNVLAADRAAPFDPAEPPLLRFTLVTTGPDDHHLALTNHHLILDGWSTPLLLHELLHLYEHHADPGALPPVRPYRDFLEWLGTRDISASVAAWNQALDGVEEPTRLVPGLDPHREPGPCSERVASLTAEQTEALRTLARTHNLTLHTIINTAWALVLATHTGTTDITFGTTVSGRPPHIPHIENMIGLFINTIPVRITLHPTDTLTTLLHHTHTTHTQLLDHHHLPLTHIPHPHATTFDTLTVHENYPHHTNPSPTDLTITTTSATDATHYPLALALATTTDERLWLRGIYQCDVFDAPAVDAILGQVTRVLVAMGKDASQPVSRVSILDADEQRALVPVCGEVADEPRTLQKILADAVARAPDAVAVVDGDRRLTYVELEARASLVADRLVETGVGPESVVAVAIPRSLESVLAVWAVAGTGAAFVPVDPTYPQTRIQHMLTDSGVRVGLTTSSRRDALPDTVTWIELEDTSAARSPCTHDSGARTTHTTRLDNAAYLIYTSGSTGLPKGVAVGHRGLNSLATTLRDHTGVTAASRVAHFASPSFDASILEYLLTWSAGATAVIVPATIYGGEELRRHLGDSRVTHAFLTPTTLADLDPRGLNDLDCVVTGGEKYTPEVIRRWSPHCRLINAYGPTESTVVADVSDAPAARGANVIGGPIRGVTEVVLDPRLQPVPLRARGELYITGDAIARGYHGKPALTAARFVADPFGPPGGRMYRSGDVVRWTTRHAGSAVLEYLGRSDSQVKVRGHRIELGEIDAVLSGHPAVTFCATLSSADGPDATLVSYVTTTGEAGSRELRDYLASRLPAQLVPSAVVPIDVIPRTPSGKLDRDALRTLRSTPRPVQPSAATPLEQTVADTLAATLDLSSLGVDDDFFAAGGHSLTATRAVARVNATLHTDLAVRSLFDAPTPRALARLIRDDTGSEPRPPLTAAARDPEFAPLSPAQQRIWFLNQYDTTTPTYNIPLTLHLTGHLDTTALHHALTDLIHRHQPLHTTYPLHHGHPTQHIHPHPTTPPLTPTPTTQTQLPQHITQDT
ncbi:amino acid adenylation domain-containing protein, partial [Rhodococcus jostii]